MNMRVIREEALAAAREAAARDALLKKSNPPAQEVVTQGTFGNVEASWGEVRRVIVRQLPELPLSLGKTRLVDPLAEVDPLNLRRTFAAIASSRDFTLGALLDDLREFGEP